LILSMAHLAHRRLQTITGHLDTHDINGEYKSDWKFIKTEKRGRVGLVTLARPSSLNALSSGLMDEVARAVSIYEADTNVGCILLTGEGRAFAAGADIKEMVGQSKFADVAMKDALSTWEILHKCRIPIVAAVNGIAFGGGCEIAMSSDIIIASENATFGQPEIKIGTIPGAGGTQRLPRYIGKSKAMELVLTGGVLSARDAERLGLVSRVVPAEKLMDEAMGIANQIANLSRPVVVLAKESVNAAFETPLTHGLKFERRLFHATFALDDRREGMAAFAEKRRPNWTHT